MESPDTGTAEALEQAWQRVQMVAFSLPLIVPMLVYVGWFMRSSPRHPVRPPAPWDPMTLLFAVLAITAVTLTPVFVDREMRAALVRDDAPSMPTVVSTHLIARYAISEIPVLLGFVVFFMGASWWVFAGFVALSVVSFAVHFPRRAVWDELVAQPPGPPRQPF